MPWTVTNVGSVAMKVAYDLLVNGEGKVATDMVQAMQESADEGVTDESSFTIVNGSFAVPSRG